MNVAVDVLTVVATVGSGLVAGLMFAFSIAVMPALAVQPAAQGMAAMQSMNIAIINPAFAVAYFGTTASCVALAVAAPFAGLPGLGWQFAGALLFLAGPLLITMVVNVPLNNALAEADPQTEEGGRLWERYLARWTTWNHVRTVIGLAGTASLVLGLLAA